MVGEARHQHVGQQCRPREAASDWVLGQRRDDHPRHRGGSHARRRGDDRRPVGCHHRRGGCHVALPFDRRGRGCLRRRRGLGGVLARGRRLLQVASAAISATASRRTQMGRTISSRTMLARRNSSFELTCSLRRNTQRSGSASTRGSGDLDALHGQQAEVELVLLPRPPLLVAAVGLVLAGLLLGAGLLFGRRVAHRVELLAQRLEDQLLLVGVDPLGLATEHMAPQPLQLHHRQLLELAVLLQVVCRDRQRVAQALLLGRDVAVLFHERIALPEERVTLLREGGHQRPKIVGGHRATRVVRPAR